MIGRSGAKHISNRRLALLSYSLQAKARARKGDLEYLPYTISRVGGRGGGD